MAMRDEEPPGATEGASGACWRRPHDPRETSEEGERIDDALLRANRALRALSDCNQGVIHARDEHELLQNVCRVIVQAGYRMAWVGFAQKDEAKTVRPVAQWGFEDGYLDTVRITWADDEHGRGPSGTACRTGAP